MIIIHHIIGCIHIHPVFPFQFITICYLRHIIIDSPWMAAVLIKDVGDMIGTAIEAWHDGKIETYAGIHIVYIGNS